MRELTCYAWGRPGDWEALCVDYDIPAQGTSLKEVRRELADAVETYLDYVADLPENEQAMFLNRKAPAVLRIRLELLSRAYTIWTLLRRQTNDNERNVTAFIMTPSS